MITMKDQGEGKKMDSSKGVWILKGQILHESLCTFPLLFGIYIKKYRLCLIKLKSIVTFNCSESEENKQQQHNLTECSSLIVFCKQQTNRQTNI